MSISDTDVETISVEFRYDPSIPYTVIMLTRYLDGHMDGQTPFLNPRRSQQGTIRVFWMFFLSWGPYFYGNINYY